MNKKQPIIALCYDFDKTLSPKDMQEYGFISKLGISPNQFWSEVNECVKEYEADRATGYMYYMIKKYKECNLDFTKQDLEECGKLIDLYKGVDTWFKRINKFAKENDCIVEHYVISSGNKEILSSTKIAKEFTKIYASSYMWDETNHAIWPALAINYTNKTQFLYRINKGITDVTDDRVNDKMPQEDRRIPFKNIVYIGDSLTDIPCMRLTMKSGGYAIGVYKKGVTNIKAIMELLDNNRLDYFVEADYSKDSEIEKVIKQIILKIKAQTNLELMSKEQKAKLNNLKNEL